MNKKTKTVLAVFAIILVAAGGILAGMSMNSRTGREASAAGTDDNAEDWTGSKDTYSGEKNADTIDIPGFDVMNMQAGTVKQSVNLYNPETNSCYFKMSILLADGTILWQSKLIEPGKAIYTLTLEQELSAGLYEDSTLKYECFAMDEEQTPLNGSEIKFTLDVLE